MGCIMKSLSVPYINVLFKTGISHRKLPRDHLFAYPPVFVSLCKELHISVREAWAVVGVEDEKAWRWLRRVGGAMRMGESAIAGYKESFVLRESIDMEEEEMQVNKQTCLRVIKDEVG
jgi:hypothetical protein